MAETKAKKKKSSAKQFEYQAEMKQLLQLIVHSLYTNQEIFLREVISNASDALNKARFRLLTEKDNTLDADAELGIQISLDKENNTLSIEDNGIGMTEEELSSRLGTIASSGTLEFIKEMQKAEKKADSSMIGQFGVGFYSVFMVASEVTVDTRHAANDSKALRWISSGEGTYTIDESDRELRGTKITLKLKEEAKEYAEDYRIKHIVNTYSNFVDFPIKVNDEAVNTVQALWHKQKSDITDEELNEFYKFISNDFVDPMGHLQLSIEGVVNFKALLFFPAKRPPQFFRSEEERSLHLYSNKVFIQNDCKDLLPEYLSFLKGVVDTEDLPLNVSREVTQNSPVMTKISNILVGKILGFLEDWAKKEPAKYAEFTKEFGQVIKLGHQSDFANKDRITNLMRFETTITEDDKFTSLENYVSRMGEDQKEIYYISGENRSALLRNPNLEYFRKNELEVLLLTDPVDVFVVPGMNEYDGKPIKSIEKADLDLDEDDKSGEEKLAENLSSSLIDVFKETLGDKVEDVIESQRLVDSPATLVSGKDALDPQMERMMKMMQQEFAGSKKIMEINTRHPLIKNLSRLNMGSSTDPMLRNCILQLFESAMLIDGELKDTSDFVQRLTDFMEAATKG
ncbi:MAG: molecular chaperone HtpG [Calditrichia bacterium]